MRISLLLSQSARARVCGLRAFLVTTAKHDLHWLEFRVSATHQSTTTKLTYLNMKFVNSLTIHTLSEMTITWAVILGVVLVAHVKNKSWFRWYLVRGRPLALVVHMPFNVEFIHVSPLSPSLLSNSTPTLLSGLFRHSCV